MPPVTDAPVVVTGATGFVASHVVKQLLDQGYAVRGTVRNVEKASSGHLGTFSGDLQLAAANLTDPGAFDDIVNGVEYVIHVASPYVLTVMDPQRDLVDPAVQGTRSILEAAHKSPSVKRVVLTSSVAAMADTYDGQTITEDTWNDTSSLTTNAYYYSKTLAERAAWDFMAEHQPHFDLVVINPFGVIGPQHGDGVNQTTQLIVDMTTFKSPMIVDLPIGLVDVRDVAASHIAAMETAGASGRYVCASASSNFTDIVAFMARHYPHIRRPRLNVSGAFGTRVVRAMLFSQPKGVRDLMRLNLGGSVVFDNSKIKQDLGIEFRSVDESLGDTIDDLVARGKITT